MNRCGERYTKVKASYFTYTMFSFTAESKEKQSNKLLYICKRTHMCARQPDSSFGCRLLNQFQHGKISYPTISSSPTASRTICRIENVTHASVYLHPRRGPNSDGQPMTMTIVLTSLTQYSTISYRFVIHISICVIQNFHMAEVCQSICIRVTYLHRCQSSNSINRVSESHCGHGALSTLFGVDCTDFYHIKSCKTNKEYYMNPNCGSIFIIGHFDVHSFESF